MLRSLIGYTRGGGSDARWVVIEGNPEFFRVTKRLHNRLHGHNGDGGPLSDEERAAYERCTEANAELLARRGSRRGRRAAARPADRRDDPADARDGGGGDLALARRDQPAQRSRARSLALPDALRRAGARLRLLAGQLRVGGARSGEADGHPAVDRRVLAEEPCDGVHERDRRAARVGARRQPPPRATRGPSTSGSTAASDGCRPRRS